MTIAYSSPWIAHNGVEVWPNGVHPVTVQSCGARAPLSAQISGSTMLVS